MSNALSPSSPGRVWRDYFELCKPRVVALMLITVLIGMGMATDAVPPLDAALGGVFGIALCAAAAAVVNHVLDRRIDVRMARTRNRPVAQGRISAARASVFAAVLGTTGTAILWLLTNPVTTALTFASLLGYAVVYTAFLKRATAQNIVIGGLAGAMPPLLGWTAITGSVDPDALLLVLIIFVWTPPHFWALALHRIDDYAKAELPMLPVVHGEAYTRVQILLYSMLLFAVSLLPFATGLSGPLYLLGAVMLGIGFLYWTVQLWRNVDARAAIRTFHYSNIYLATLFSAMLIDRHLQLDIGLPLS